MLSAGLTKHVCDQSDQLLPLTYSTECLCLDLARTSASYERCKRDTSGIGTQLTRNCRALDSETQMPQLFAVPDQLSFSPLVVVPVSLTSLHCSQRTDQALVGLFERRHARRSSAWRFCERDLHQASRQAFLFDLVRLLLLYIASADATSAGTGSVNPSTVKPS